MTKRLVERALERLKERSKKSYSHNKAVFLSLSGEIKEALDAGISLKTVWETLYAEGKICFKYDTFLRYSRQYLKILEKRNPPITKNNVVKTNMQNIKKVSSDIPANKNMKNSSKIKTFEIDSGPNVEDFM